MAAENFKVKKGLEVGTAITATSSGVNVTGIVTATQFVGDGSGLTGVTGSGSGVVVKDEGSAVGTAGTINFVGSGVAATLSQGTATVTINAGGLDNVVEDLTPQLGGNLDLNGKFVNGTGGANITGVVTATTLKGNGDFVDIDVDGHTELDNLNVAGVSTFGGSATFAANGYLTTTAGITIENSQPGVLFNDTTANPDFIIQNRDGSFAIRDVTSAANRFLVNMANGDVTVTGGLDVDGQTDLDDLVVSGVGTFSTRIDTNGVSFGTNNNTFAAQFVDDAVANFGTHNDLKISHDDTHARITNTKGDIVVSGIISATSDIKVGSAITMDPTSGIVTATKFIGDGSGLTGVTASGSGIVVKHDGSTVGTAGTINFSTNLDVSAISAGIVTVTASGGSSQNLFSTIAVSGQSNVVADSTTDTLTFAAGSNVTLTTNAGTDTVTIAAANDNTQLSSEQVQDIVGAMFSSNTETDITATYQDADGTIDLVVDLSSLNASNLDSGTIPNGRFPATLPATSGANLTALNASEITSGTLPIARIADEAVTFAKMQHVGTGVFIGRDSSGTGDIETLSAAEARTLLNVADGATVGITTANTNVTATWSIGGNSGSGYQFTGPGQDGSEGNPDIYLVRGHKYRFVNTTGTGHPFAFRNEANNAAYTDGITGSQSGTQEFNVQHDAPAALKYRCTIHTGSMLGNIYIVGQHLANGANNRVLTATSAYGMNGESNLTFNGSTLAVSGSQTISGDLDVDGRTELDNVNIVGITTIRNASGTKLYEGVANGSKLFHAGGEKLSTELHGISVNGTVVSKFVDLTSGGHSGIITASSFQSSGDGGISTFDVGAPSSSNKVIGRFQAQSSRQLDIVWHDSGSLMGFNTPGNHSYIFKCNNTERLRIRSDGDTTISASASANFFPGAALDIVSDKNVENGIDDKANYHLALANPNNDTGEAIGIAFGITDTSTKVGAAIVHERDAAGSQGGLKFFTRPNNAGPPVERIRIGSDGILTLTNHLVLGNSDEIKLGSSSQMTIWHTGSDFTMYNNAGQLIISNASGTGVGEGEIVFKTGNNNTRWRMLSGGDFIPASNNSFTVGSSSNRVAVFYSNTSLNTSDRNEKNTITDSDLGLSFINKLRPVSYKWNQKEGEILDTKTHYGLIAQDIEETVLTEGKEITDFGFIDKPKEGQMSLAYSELISPLIKAVQELSEEVAALKSQLNN